MSARWQWRAQRQFEPLKGIEREREKERKKWLGITYGYGGKQTDEPH